MKKAYLIVLVTTLICFLANQGLSQNWTNVGGGLTCHPSNFIWKINRKENNSGLLIAGTLGNLGAGGLCDMRAALLWNGYEYSEVAIPEYGSISSLAFDFQGNTYCSGSFAFAPEPLPDVSFNVKTDAGLWDTVPGGFDGIGRDYCIYNNVAFICGAFNHAGYQPCALVCSFDGEQVVPVYHHPYIENSAAFSIAFYQDTLFVSGNFPAENSELLQQGYGQCAKIVDGQMLRVGNGFSYPTAASSMKELNGKLYMGGWFSPLGSNQSYSMMYYENGQMHTLPSYPNLPINGMKYYNGALYVVGEFDHIGNMPCNKVARYDGQEWTCLCNQPIYRDQPNADCYPCIRDLEIWNDTLYIGGLFGLIGNTELKRIAKLDMALSEAFPVNITEQQRQALKLNVYPNPAQTTITIQANQPTQVEIYTATGKLIEVLSSKQIHILDISKYASGLYVARCGAEAMRFVRG